MQRTRRAWGAWSTQSRDFRRFLKRLVEADRYQCLRYPSQPGTSERSLRHP